MEEDGHDVTGIFFRVSAVELLGAGLSEDDGVDAFQVGWVGYEA